MPTVLPQNWTADPVDDPDARLVAGRCTRCGSVFVRWPRLCYACPPGSDVVDQTLGNVGTLYSHTIVHRGPSAFPAPYALAYVDLPEGPRIFGHLDTSDAAPAIGSLVKVYGGPIGHTATGELLFGARFRPHHNGSEVG